MPCYDNRNDVERERLRNVMEEGWSSQTFLPPPSQPMWSSSHPVETPKNPNKEALLEVLLCSACRVLTRTGYDFDENPALSNWWAAHKKEDNESKATK